MGPVKSGKSTLFRTLAGRFEGHTLHRSWGATHSGGVSLSPSNRPALVQQHASVFDLSLLDTLLQPVRHTQRLTPVEWREKGLEWLSVHHLGEYAAQADKSLTLFNSVAQRSILILAQALLKPQLLLIDEPTYGLDDKDSAWLLGWLKQLSAHCKLWVCLHNQSHARRLADRIVLIGGGRVLAHQNTAQFFQSPANESADQFIRTGSFALPSLGAQAQDLEPGVPVPPPLSINAQRAIREFVTPATTKVDLSPSVHSDQQIVEIKLIEDKVKVRQPVQLPSSSRDGVELAAAVGNYIFRDSSGPRGFHWIVPGKLAGCPAPGVSAAIDYDLSLLARSGISHLITLTESNIEQKALRHHFLTNTHLPVLDREAPSIAQMHMLLVRMQKKIADGEVLAVHCKAGLGRTGTVLAAWLIREGGLTATISIARLRKIESGYIQSLEQEDFLHRYEADIVRRIA
jgi:atypical dual specificity phosphatase